MVSETTWPQMFKPLLRVAEKFTNTKLCDPIHFERHFSASYCVPKEIAYSSRRSSMARARALDVKCPLYWRAFHSRHQPLSTMELVALKWTWSVLCNPTTTKLLSWVFFYTIVYSSSSASHPDLLLETLTMKIIFVIFIHLNPIKDLASRWPTFRNYYLEIFLNVSCSNRIVDRVSLLVLRSCMQVLKRRYVVSYPEKSSEPIMSVRFPCKSTIFG